MKDTWGFSDYRESSQIYNDLRNLEQEYICKYGELPKLDGIEAVFQAKKTLENV